MTQSHGMWHQTQWVIFGKLGAVCLFCASLLGCGFVGPSKTPIMRGSWEGELHPVAILDEMDASHTVVGVAIVRPISVKAYKQGYILAPAGYVHEKDQEPLQQAFWSFSQSRERVALLRGEEGSMIPFDNVQAQNRQVVFIGELRYDEPPKFSGQRVVRLNNSAVVVQSDGTEKRTYTSSVDLIADGVLNDAAPKKE